MFQCVGMTQCSIVRSDGATTLRVALDDVMGVATTLRVALGIMRRDDASHRAGVRAAG
ncbi:hypothetical protein X751_04430 [Mesorhizobium sp. LNJC395A00]|nr:hypothetical protein X754_04910 [Mesorhizobium sp. LNJC403B00]ESY24732.1 hypothetical protein X751_04430 [Mesorhizobium sp. LNJC395A00]